MFRDIYLCFADMHSRGSGGMRGEGFWSRAGSGEVEVLISACQQARDLQSSASSIFLGHIHMHMVVRS